MKKLFFLLLLSTSSFAQDKFSIKKEGLTDYVVTSVNGSATDLYNKTIKWIKETYKNPNEVIKMTIDDEKLRFEGFKQNFNCLKAGGTTMCSNASYQIEISFKDNKYRFDPIELILSNQSGNKNIIDLNDFTVYYDKDGNFKRHSKESIESIENLFNGLNDSLKNYIENQTKKDEW